MSQVRIQSCSRSRLSALRTASLTIALMAVGSLFVASAVDARPRTKPSPAAPSTSLLVPGGAPPSAESGGPIEPSGSPTMPGYSTRSSFTFAVMGDSAPPAPGLPVPSTFFRIWGDLGVLHPDFVMHTGNVIWARPGSGAEAQSQFTRIQALTSSESPIPMYVAPGNKDIPDEEADVAFRKSVSGGPPWRSFDYGSSHFIVLSTEAPGEVGHVGGEQLDWLKSDLAAHANAAHTFVFEHRTAFPTGDASAESIFGSDPERDSFASLMAQSHVTTVFSGGQANFSQSTHDGVNYVNSGGAGGSSSSGPTDGGFQHYLVVKVDGDNVTVSPIEPGRIDVRPLPTDTGFKVWLYNTSMTPLVLNRVMIPVPQQWRAKHPGLLGSDRLRLYQLTATAADSHAVDAAAIELNAAPTTRPADPDLLYFRVQVPAGTAVGVTVAAAQ